MIEPIIQTPRLTLIRLTDKTTESQHARWFHEHWTDADATSWSLRGMSKTPEESISWMTEHLDKYDNLIYAVFIKPESNNSSDQKTNGTEEVNPGIHVGAVSLRRQLPGPAIPPLARKAGDETKALDMRVVGYGFSKSGWGKGYATEANRALLDAYAASIAEEKAQGDKVFYIEAGVDEGNPASMRVIEKLGFTRVGFKEETEPVFLGGAWRYDGYWIYGMYL